MSNSKTALILFQFNINLDIKDVHKCLKRLKMPKNTNTLLLNKETSNISLFSLFQEQRSCSVLALFTKYTIDYQGYSSSAGCVSHESVLIRAMTNNSNTKSHESEAAAVYSITFFCARGVFICLLRWIPEPSRERENTVQTTHSHLKPVSLP